MKPNKEYRPTVNEGGADELVRKAARLQPNKKSGKDRHMLYSSLDDDDDLELEEYRPRESVLDYFDDQEEDL